MIVLSVFGCILIGYLETSALHICLAKQRDTISEKKAQGMQAQQMRLFWSGSTPFLSRLRWIF